MKLSTEQEKKIEELIDILICPQSGDDLVFDKKKNELISKKAKLAYPIIDGIPVMQIEKARKF